MVHLVESVADFDEQIKNAGDKLVVVDFFATWCGPCKVIAPVLEKLAQQYASNLVVVKVDVDECEDLAMRFDISSMPTFVFLKKGEKVEVFSGANPDKLEKTIVQYLN
ncbi:thioredoxin-2-like [Sitodiplosis mosellana]|uniref:thioredoxin-2-like n=1 Tax=Sitodiplosis mosellana TaxID=263140 RepID=UPI0024445F0C|nr:thioredoxin-2-like [Sitodiplosis mosellana]